MPDESPAQKGSKPLLALAAESIAAVSGVAETVVDVLHGRAFRHYAEGIRQYVAIRLGSADEAADAMNELRAIVATHGSEELVQSPGIRARLYRLARDVVKRRSGTGPEGDRAALPWRRPANPHYDGVLWRLREELSDKEAELLDLRYARELMPEEIAHVVEMPLEEVERKLEAARVQARFLVGDDPATSTEAMGQALVEAFALEPAPETAEDGEHEPLPLGTIIGGRYEVESRVGSGAFADVYRAKDTEVPGHVVAVKLLHQASLSEDARERALRELHLIASVFHPSVVQFKDHGWHEQRLWFVMPWYEGETLEDRMEREPLSRAEARRIFTPLTEALATMHAAGIRHQDVKPDNIFLARLRSAGDEDAVLPVLLDLGVAAKEAEMIVAGTPTYFAPEVASQFATVPVTHPISNKSDVFSLALSLRNALEPSTQADVPAGAVEHFIEHRAQHSPETPLGEELGYLGPHFKRWLSLDPDERPTAEELARELAVLTQPEERRARRNKILAWVVPIGVTVAVTFAAVVWILGREAELERLEAERARIEAADAIADLGEESERRQALEEDVERIRDTLQSSRLTKQQLTDRLAEREGQLNQSRALLARQRRTTENVREALVEQRAEGERLSGELSTARSELTTERARTESLTTELEDTRTRLEDARGDLEVAREEAATQRERIATLQAETSTLRGQLESQQASASVLERRIAEAEAARTRAENQLEAAQRRIAQLERQLARRGTVIREGDTGGGAEETPGSDTTGGEAPGGGEEGT